MRAFHVRLMVVNAGGGYHTALMRNAPRPAHRYPIGLAQPISFHSLLCGHRIVTIEYAISVQQRR